jgi:4-amino-4-deoxy-L-arabinose transferase-like glycosyltransferase
VTRRFGLEALAMAGLLALAGVLFARSLHTRANFDEGVYLASLDALRHGQALGTVVNVPQPPGFYVLLQLFGAVFGHAVADVRIGFLLVALAGLVAAFFVGRAVSGTAGGLAAAGLLAVTAPYPAQAAQVEADTVSTILALAAIAFLIGRKAGPPHAAASGALAAAAVSVKLLALPVAAPLAVLLIARRSWGQAAAFAAGALVVAAALAIRYAYALGALWDSVVVEHRNAQSLGSFGDNVHRVLLHPLDWHTPAGLLIPIGVVLAAIFARSIQTAALGAWIVASAAFLLYQRPLLDHHLVLIATALAVTAGVGFGAAAQRLPHRALALGAAALGLAVAAGFAQEHRRLARDDQPEPPEVRWAVDWIRAETRPTELVATDLPIVAYLSDRRVPGQLIDSSYGRLLSGTQTTPEILAVLRREQVRAVLVGRNYRLKPGLIAALGARYPRRLSNGVVTLYLAARS